MCEIQQLNLKAFVTETRSLEYLEEQYAVLIKKYQHYRNLHILFAVWLDAIEYNQQPKIEKVQSNLLIGFDYYV